MFEVLETLPALTPSAFYSVSHSVGLLKSLDLDQPFKKDFELTSISSLLDESPFADIGIRWHMDGIMVFAEVKKSFSDTDITHFAKGDALEIFIDTKNIKTAVSIHKFCHHFVCMAKEKDGVQAQEITRFRLEDSHPLAKTEHIPIHSSFTKSSYSMNIWLSKDILHGYDPSQYPSIGFEYRLHGSRMPPQHFSLSKDINFDKHPALWSELKLIQK